MAHAHCSALPRCLSKPTLLETKRGTDPGSYTRCSANELLPQMQDIYVVVRPEYPILSYLCTNKIAQYSGTSMVE